MAEGIGDEVVVGSGVSAKRRHMAATADKVKENPECAWEALAAMQEFESLWRRKTIPNGWSEVPSGG